MKTLRPKKTKCPHLPPIFDEIPNKYDRKCSTFWKNLSTIFWFRRDISFWQFFDRQKTVKKLSKQDISPKSKKYTKIFCKYGRLSSIFIGEFIKNWGQGVALGFFWPQSFHSLTVIFDKKKLANQKILFPKTQY